MLLLFVPRRLEDNITEACALITRQVALADIGVDIAKRRLGFVLDAVEKRMQYLVLEAVAGEGRDDLHAYLFGEFIEAITQDVEAHSMIEQRNYWFLVLGHPDGLMERDRIPDKLSGFPGEAMLLKQAASRIGSIYLEAFIWTAVMLRESKIVK